MNLKKQLEKLLEQNIASAGGAFGDADSMGHGGDVGNSDFYEPNDSRLPKPLGVTVSRAGAVGSKKKKKRKVKKTLREAEVSIEDILKTYDKFKKPKKDPSEYDPIELHKGTKVEMEHTTDEKLAKIIAMIHLDELDDYYTRLAEMEKKSE